MLVVAALCSTHSQRAEHCQILPRSGGDKGLILGHQPRVAKKGVLTHSGHGLTGCEPSRGLTTLGRAGLYLARPCLNGSNAMSAIAALQLRILGKRLVVAVEKAA